VLTSAAFPASAAGATKIGEIRLQATKAAVSNSIDAAIDALYRLDNGVRTSALTDGQKSALKFRVQENITWLEAKKADVHASSDVAGVLANAREANERWNSVYPCLKKEIGFMASDNVDATIATARSASAVASGKAGSMKARGKDTSAIETALASYNAHVDSAARRAANARSEFDSIGTAKPDIHYAAGFRQLNEAGNELKYAYKDMKKIYRLFYGDSVKIS